MGLCLSKKKPMPPEHAQLVSNVTSSHVPFNAETNGIALQHNSSFQSPRHIQTSFQSTFNTSASTDNSHQKDSSEKTVIALFPYESRSDGDLSFGKNDVMTLLEDKDNDWWFVRDKHGKTGYVPRNFVAVRKTLESEEWFAGNVSRSQAEKMVLSSNPCVGTYLIRERDAANGKYALSVKHKDGMTSNCVKHYLIHQFGNSDRFYITSKMQFNSLKDLVQHYSEKSDGLCTMLTLPAPRLMPALNDLSHQTKDKWEIPRHELQLQEKIGSGQFGEVYRGTWRGQVLVAIKTLKPGTMTNNAFLEEAAIMKNMVHPNLIRLYAVCTTEEPFYICTEYMKNGSLLSYLRNDKNLLNLKCLIDIGSQVANGMCYLEERNYVHRDLAARNVLVGEEISTIPLVKIADFGLARALRDEGVYEVQSAGTKIPYKWCSPEAALNGNFTVKSDIWSFGILMFEIMTRGQIPYPTMSNHAVLNQVVQGYRMPQPQGCPPPVYEMMLQCWAKEPQARPTFSYLYTFLDDYFVSSQGAYLPPES